MTTGTSSFRGSRKADSRTKTTALVPGSSAASCVEHTPTLVRSAAPFIGSRSTLTVMCTVRLSLDGADEIV